MAHRDIIGMPLHGKELLLHRMIKDSVDAGHAVLVFDPYSHTTDTVLQHIHHSRVQDVVVFDERIKWDALRESDNLPLVAQSWFESAHAAWRMGIGTPNMEMMIQSLIYTAVLTGRTVFEAFQLIRVPEKTPTGHVLLDEFWEWYAKKNDRDKDAVSASTYNKLYTLFLDERMQQLFDCKTGRFQFKDMLNDKVVFARLPISEFGTDRVALIVSLILSQIKLVVQHRDPSTPLDIYLLQADLYAPRSIIEGLSMFGLYNTHLTLSYEATSQLDDELLAAVLATSAERYAFRVSSADAKLFTDYGVKGAKELDSYVPNRYRSFPWQGHAIFEWVQPLPPGKPGRAEKIRKRSTRFYC